MVFIVVSDGDSEEELGVLGVLLHESSFHFWGGGVEEVAGGSEGGPKHVGDHLSVGADSLGDVLQIELPDLLELLPVRCQHLFPLPFSGDDLELGDSLPENVEVNAEMLHRLLDEGEQIRHFQRTHGVVPNEH